MPIEEHDIEVLEVDEIAVCPSCGYDGGFHSIFFGLNDLHAKWILMCPSCKAKYDIGLRYKEI